jgi:hypothetical protein
MMRNGPNKASPKNKKILVRTKSVTNRMKDAEAPPLVPLKIQKSKQESQRQTAGP